MNNKQRRFPRLAALALAGAAAGLAAPAANALNLYDDFSGSAISPGRWDGREGTQWGATLAEARRSIQSGQLRLEVKGWSDRYTNSGFGRARNQEIFETSANITEIKATVTARTMAAGACAANATAGSARARIIGTFFNIGDVKPGSEYNDVIAAIQMARASNSTDPAGVMQVIGAVYICTDNECIATSTVGSVSLGTATVNEATDLHLTWDKANKQFIFQLNSEAPHNVVYTFAESHVPSYGAKRLEADADAPNCTAASRATTSTVVDFDNVYTN